MHVVATCLYTICRQEKSPHLLIDFSDILRINVYVLGKNFLQFTRLLNLKLPIVDPSLYIHRFATKLDLGDKLNSVVTTSLRFVTRFNKDWITTGMCLNCSRLFSSLRRVLLLLFFVVVISKETLVRLYEELVFFIETCISFNGYIKREEYILTMWVRKSASRRIGVEFFNMEFIFIRIIYASMAVYHFRE